MDRVIGLAPHTKGLRFNRLGRNTRKQSSLVRPVHVLMLCRVHS